MRTTLSNEIAASKKKKNNGLLGKKRGQYKKHIPLTTRQVAIQNNELYYFTGHPCKHGHITKRLTSDGGCVGCRPIKRKRVYEAHREVILQRQSQKRMDNPEISVAYRKRYQAEPKNKETKRIAQLRRLARQMQAEGSFTKEDVDNLKIQQEFKCAVCNCDLNISGYHIDHKTPLSRNGSNYPDNLQLLCPLDNVRKNDLTNLEYLQKLGKII